MHPLCIRGGLGAGLLRRSCSALISAADFCVTAVESLPAQRSRESHQQIWSNSAMIGDGLASYQRLSYLWLTVECSQSSSMLVADILSSTF